MKKNTKIIYISELILLIYVVLTFLFANNISSETKTVASIIVLSVILVLLLSFFGIKKDSNYLKGSVTRIVVASLMTFLIIIYSLGIITGFYRGYLINSFNSLFRVLIPVIIIIIETEVIRFLIVKNCFKNKKAIILFTIISSLFSIALEMNLGVLISRKEIFVFVSTIVLPIIAEEALCSFITYKVSMLPSLIYILVIKLYVYIIPIVPDLGNYIYSVLFIILPFVIYSIVNKMVIRYEKEKQELKKINKTIFIIPALILFVILMILISGIFKYKLIAIASNSMKPIYGRGDAVIYEKIKTDQLEQGDILVFKKDKLVVTHRITRIWKQDGNYYYNTKGDNNDTDDSFKVKEENVLGRVKYVIKYIGYPTVLINEYFREE